MTSSNLKVGDKIRFNLKSSYSSKDLTYGCDTRVDGMTGTIQCIWDQSERCVVKLDTPLTYDNKRVYEYWDFPYNMTKISSNYEPLNFEKAWNELKVYLYSKHNTYGLSGDDNDHSRLNTIDDIIKKFNEIENNIKP